MQFIEKGKYCKENTSEIEVASHLLKPSYISFLSALSILGLTDQIPIEINLVALRQKKSLYFNNYRITFSTFPKKLFFGYTEHDNIFIAEPEKAILDSLYLNVVPLEEIVKVLNESDINFDKLIDYALRMDSKILLKRLGYILDSLDIPASRKLVSYINTRRTDVLNPLLSSGSKRNKKWHLYINEDLV